ncbi:hypothetical protein [Pyrobaculum sp.]|uniref:hypothetical protein n=1 Tax=Pyrobaculum sp. TaxID=2004705 RepID=UPI003168EFAC
MKKLTLSVREEALRRVRAVLGRSGLKTSISELFDDYIALLDGEGLAEELCRELGVDCGGRITTPEEVKAKRPASLGAPTSELVRELRRARESRL